MCACILEHSPQSFFAFLLPPLPSFPVPGSLSLSGTECWLYQPSPSLHMHVIHLHAVLVADLSVHIIPLFALNLLQCAVAFSHTCVSLSPCLASPPPSAFLHSSPRYSLIAIGEPGSIVHRTSHLLPPFACHPAGGTSSHPDAGASLSCFIAIILFSALCRLVGCSLPRTIASS